MKQAWMGGVVLLAGCQHGSVPVASTPYGISASGIGVTGMAEATFAPELARLVIGVEARSPRLEDAMREVAERSAVVQAKLTALGIAAADVEGAGFEVAPEEPRPPPYPMGIPMLPPGPPPMPPTAPFPSPGPAAGDPALGQAPAATPSGETEVAKARMMSVSNRYQITIRDVAKLRTVLAELLAAGANRVTGLSCDVKDRMAALAQLRAKAVTNANQRAQQLAQATGVELGKVITVMEGPAEAIPPMAMPMSGMGYGYGERVAMPEMAVSCDQVRLIHTVTVQYEIE